MAALTARSCSLCDERPRPPNTILTRCHPMSIDAICYVDDSPSPFCVIMLCWLSLLRHYSLQDPSGIPAARKSPMLLDSSNSWPQHIVLQMTHAAAGACSRWRMQPLAHAAADAAGFASRSSVRWCTGVNMRCCMGINAMWGRLGAKQLCRDMYPGQLYRDMNPGQLCRDVNPGQLCIFMHSCESACCH